MKAKKSSASSTTPTIPSCIDTSIHMLCACMTVWP